ncbi:MAG TPA: hypothetical protein VGL23_19445 [Chloroflexota bacterium]
MSAQENETLGSWFARAARAAGHAGLWRAYVSGRLGVAIDDWRLEQLAGCPTPRDRAESDALAAEFSIDPLVLWWMVEESADALTVRG